MNTALYTFYFKKKYKANINQVQESIRKHTLKVNKKETEVSYAISIKVTIFQ